MSILSVAVPYAPPRPQLILPYAELVQETEAVRLWQGQALTCEPHQAFAYAAGHGYRIPVGVGVALTPFRHPLDAALHAHQLAVAMGEPVVAGYGAGALEFQRMVLGQPYRSQLGALREYLTIMRALLDGEAVDHAGEYFTCAAQLPALPRPPVEIGLGVLRPKAARLAGQVADVAITWLTSPKYLREVLVPALEEGAAEAGRPRPRLVTLIPLAREKPGRAPHLEALSSAALHLQLGHYRAMLARSGVTYDLAAPEAAGAALVEGGVFLYGTPDRLADGIAEHREAGVDEAVLHVSGLLARFGEEAALDELRTLVPLLAEACAG